MDSRLLPAAIAASRLGVKRATLYAYVSRGLLTAYTRPASRGSWFDPVQLDALVSRARDPSERRPDLRITSAITLIDRGQYWYRGESPRALADSRLYEQVAEWLWTGDRAAPEVAWPVDRQGAERARAAQATLPAEASAADRLRVIVPVLGASDAMRFDLRSSGAVATARRLMATTGAALGTRVRGGIAVQVASWLSPRRMPAEGVRAIERALIVMADHELAASTLAVRVAASFRADPYAAVAAGLGAMAGTFHGGASRRVEEAFVEIARGGEVTRAVGGLLHDADTVPGFGHPLYPDGDPRVALLLPVIRALAPARMVDAVLKVAAAQRVPPPNVDFALAALAHALRLAPGAAEAIFTVGRLAGWLAHALEEYADRSDFRMRAVYTGPRPG